MKKRLLSLIICFALCISVLPTAVFAADIANGNGWNLDSKGILHITGAVSFPDKSGDNTPWKQYKSQIVSAVAEQGSSVNNCQYLFDNCTNLVSADLKYLNTSTVTKMWYMFDGCTSLSRLDVSGFDTPNVTTMFCMFNKCSSLTELDLSSFLTFNVTNMSYMFSGCSALTSLDISHFDTYNTADSASGMFNLCESLTELCIDNSSGFLSGSIYALTELSNEWLDKETGKSYTTSEDFRSITGKITLIKDLFVPDPTGWNVDDNGVLHITGAINNETTTLSDRTPWKNYKSQITAVIAEPGASAANCKKLFADCASLEAVDLRYLNTSAATDMSYMFANCESLEALNLRYLNTSNAEDMSNMFDGCSNLTSLNVSGFNTAKAFDMGSMFEGCQSLTALDLSGFNTASAAFMYGMFYECSSLTSLDLSNFSTASAYDFSGMFYNCRNLTTLNIGSFHLNTLDVTDYMFTGCDKLAQLTVNHTVIAHMAEDLIYISEVWQNAANNTFYSDADELLAIYGTVTLKGNFGENSGWYIDPDGVLHITGSVVNTSKYVDETPWKDSKGKITSVIAEKGSSINNCAFLFSDCYYLTEVDIGNLDISSTKSTEAMFKNCSRLRYVDLRGIDTSNVTDMTGMFEYCSYLPAVDVSSLNTANVESARRMFFNCQALTSIDVTGFDTSRMTDMYQMFADCISLKTLDVSGFDTSNVEFFGYMFDKCVELESLDVSGFETANAIYMSGMFLGCSGLYYLDLSGFDFGNEPSLYDFITGCTGLTELKADGSVVNKIAYGLDSLSPLWQNIETGALYSDVAALQSINGDVSLLKVYFIAGGAGWKLDEFGTLYINGAVTNTSDESDSTPWVDYKYDIKTVTVSADVQLTNCRYLFADCPNLRRADLTRLNLGSGADTTDMFGGCTGLTEIKANAGIFSKTAGQIIAISNDWHNKATGTVYATADAVRAISGNEVLLRNITGSGWYLDNDGVLHITGAVTNPSDYFDRTPWAEYKAQIKSVVTHTGASVDKGSYLFCDCPMLTQADLSKLNAPNLKTADSMFGNCRRLVSVDLSGLGTAALTNTAYMFWNCSSLKTVDLSPLNTANVTNMSNMFEGCSSLASINFGSFNTQSVTGFNEMFLNCAELTSLDLSGFNTAAANRLSNMFEGCTKLAVLNIGNFDISGAQYTGNMFYGCSSLNELTVSPSVIAKNADQIIALSQKWANKDNGTVYTTDSELKTLTVKTALVKIAANGSGWYLDEAGTLHINGAIVNNSSYNDKTPWREYKNRIKAVSAESGASVRNGAYLFFNCSNLVTADIGNLDTSSLSDADRMFAGCNKLASLDLSGLNTSSVTSMAYMFQNCSTLKSLDVSGFDTGNAAELNNMFDGCTGLTELIAGNAVFAANGKRLLLLSPVWENKTDSTLYTDEAAFDALGNKTAIIKSTGLSGRFIFSKGAVANYKKSFVTGLSTNPSALTEYIRALSGYSFTCGSYGTGSTVDFKKNGRTIYSCRLVISGDLNGDGVCDALDAAECERAANDHTSLEGAFFAAGDCDEDADLDVNDYAAVVNAALA